jgi:hypothetical protein
MMREVRKSLAPVHVSAMTARNYFRFRVTIRRRDQKVLAPLLFSGRSAWKLLSL